MPYVYLCDMCCESLATQTRRSNYCMRDIGVCEKCYDYMWAQAKRESSKFSEFKSASDASAIFDRDGSCWIFDSLVNTIARKIALQEKQNACWANHEAASEASETAMTDVSDK